MMAPMRHVLPQDVRFAFRALRKTPGFTLVTILTIAVAIGANSGIFSLIDVLLLRKLQVRAPDELVQVSLVNTSGASSGLSFPLFDQLRLRQQVFSGMLIYVGGGGLALQTPNGFRIGNVWAVTGNFHEELGQSALIGRLFTPAEISSGADMSPPVAVLGYRCWVREYGASPTALGQQISVEGVRFTIVGVTQPGFGGLGLGEDPEVTVPLSGFALALPDATGRPLDLQSRVLQMTVAARLKRGTTIEQASAQLESLRSALLGEVVPDGLTPGQRDAFVAQRFDVRSAATGVETSLRSRFTQPLFILLGIAAAILLIACAHLASLMLARASARSHEISVMVALGATRWRIARGILAEGLLLAAAGAAAGLQFARWSSELVANFMTARYSIPPRLDFTPDTTVLAVTTALAIATGVLFSIVPIWLVTRGDPSASVRASGDRSRASGRAGRLLIVAQVALSIAVMTIAVLLGRSVDNVRSGDAGFRKDQVLTTGLRSVAGGYQQFDPNSYYRDLLDRVRSVPGVRTASLSKGRPANFAPQKDTIWPIASGKDERYAIEVAGFGTSPGLFEVLGIPLTGRDFAWTDDDRHAPVAILSRELATRLFGSGDAIGQPIRLGRNGAQSVEVIGIAGDARMFDPRQPPPLIVYTPVMETPAIFLTPFLAVRADSDLTTVRAGVTRAIDSLGREYAARFETMNQVVDGSLIAERMSAGLAGFLALVTLALAAIGLFALMSYLTTRRRREIGIRLALGADPRSLKLSVVRESVSLVATGLLAGVPLAIAAARSIASVLIGVSAWDPLTLVAVSLTLLIVGAAAGYGPARRISRADPMAALRCE